MSPVEAIILSAPRLRFDAAIPTRADARAYQGLRTHGPFDRSRVQFGDGALLFVFPEAQKDLAHQLAQTWLRGVGTFPGFQQMFRVPVATGEALKSLSIATDLRDPVTAARVYRDGIAAWSAQPRERDPLLALVLVPHSEPWQTDRPYYEAKAAFANLGIPSQMITSELVSDESQFQWAVANIALASFAKLGGIPWTVEAPDDDDDLIIGIGRREVGPEDDRRRIFGYAVTFVSNGIYRQTWSFTPAADQDTYLDRLGEAITAALQNDLDTRPQRLVIHLSSKTGRDEITVVQQAMVRAGVTLPVAFLRLDDSSLWTPPTPTRTRGRPARVWSPASANGERSCTPRSSAPPARPTDRCSSRSTTARPSAPRSSTGSSLRSSASRTPTGAASTRAPSRRRWSTASSSQGSSATSPTLRHGILSSCAATCATAPGFYDHMTAAPDALHLLAHRAGLRQREREDWWGSAIETALAGISATRHPPAQREQAEQALAGLERWSRAGTARAISADAVALALAARIAATLGRSDVALRDAAITAVEAMAQRTQEVIPELHVALAVWGLEAVLLDRGARPWPALRERLERGSVYGLDAALRAYASAVAAPQLDAAGLVRSLITLTPLSPELGDGSTVLWLLAVALDLCTAALPATDSGLNALLERRTSITGRLAVELDADAFRAPDLTEFDPTVRPAAGETPAIYLSSMEALMLDVALAPAADEAPWLTLPQAENLLGDRARKARAAARRERLNTALTLAVGAVTAGAALCFGLVVAGSAWRVSIAFGLALALAVAAAAVAVAHSVLARRPVSAAAGAACVTGALCAALNAINELLAKPLLSDAAGVITGAVIVSVATVMWALLADHDDTVAGQ